MKRLCLTLPILIMVFCVNIFMQSAIAQDGIELVWDEETIIVSSQDAQSGTWGTCAWNISDEGVLTVHPGIGENAPELQHSPWYEYRFSVKEIIFEGFGNRSVQVYDSAAYLFADLNNVENINFSGLKLINVADMNNMFKNCSSLRRLELANFDTSSTKNMASMFQGCTVLKSLDVSSWDVSKVTNMEQMFYQCSNLEFLDVSKWNTSRVNNMSRMFMGCSFLKGLDVSRWNTMNVKDMSYLFSHCLLLSSIDVSGWNTSLVTSIDSMFSGCEKLENVDLSSFDLQSLTSMEYAFRDCLNLKTVDAHVYNTGSVKSIYGLFSGCRLLSSADLSGWNTSSLINLGSVFYDCKKLTSAKFEGWDTSKVTKTEMMFYGCASLRTLDLSSWDTSSVREFGAMYQGCSVLDMISVGEGYKILGKGMFPAPTSVQGLWWSKATETWLSREEIANNRSNVADIYYSYDVGQSGTSVSGATIILDKDKYGWMGGEIKPSVTVKIGNTTLIQGTDYNVSYKNNINVGTGQVIVSGVGRYKDTAAKDFEISYAAYYRDVDASTYHVTDIIWLTNAGISTGWNLGNGVYEFRPSSPVARADMASFLFRLARKWGLVDNSWRPTYATTDLIFDVSSSTTSHYISIWWLVETGISEGWPRTLSYQRDFRPYASVTRQDMAAFLYRLAKLAGRGGASDTWTANAAAKKKFSDVDSKNASNHHNEVWWLAQTGISEGWKVGNTYQFRGMQPVTRQDMAAFLHRMDALK